MATPRETIAAQLVTDQPSWDVYSYPTAIAEVRTPAAVVVYRTDMSPIPGGLGHDVTLQLYGRGAGGSKTEADLDSRLDDVMLSLQRLAGVQVKKASRKTFADSSGRPDVFHGWELDLSWTSSDIYKAQV